MPHTKICLPSECVFKNRTIKKMQLKHFEHLANLERSIVKEQFQKAVKAPVLPFGPKIGEQKRVEGKQKPKERKLGKENAPQAARVTAVTGDAKIPNPYTAGKTRQYPKNPTEKQIREQRGKTAALVANDGLTPGQGGALGPMHGQAAMHGRSGKLLFRPRLKSKTWVM